jgi:hypothetical protein
MGEPRLVQEPLFPQPGKAEFQEGTAISVTTPHRFIIKVTLHITVSLTQGQSLYLFACATMHFTYLHTYA